MRPKTKPKVKPIVKTAGKIMEEVRALTGWNFAGAMKGDTCRLAAALVNESGKKLEVAMEITGGDVLLSVTTAEPSLDQAAVDRIKEKIVFPVDAELKEGVLVVSCQELLGVLEHSVKGVMKERVIPMVDAVAEAIAD